jgi:hypothetical protein
MFKQYQEVVLVRESLQDTFFGTPVDLRRGQQGVIVEVYNRLGCPTGYDVEFFDADGETIAVTTVQEGDIAAVSVEELMSKPSKSRKKGLGSQVA